MSAIDTLSSISALFPDDAPHKHPETGVSLLDDVRDVIEDGRRWRYRESDVRYELNKHKQYLETASHQINHLRGINEYLLKAITEPIETQISPMYIMKSNSGLAVAATKALDVLSAVNQIGAISWNQELKRSVEDAITELRKVL